MDGEALLHRARDAGLRVEAAGDVLKITGPKQAEPVVRLLAQHKAKVLTALAAMYGGSSYWQEQFTVRTFEWFNGNRNWISARRVAWGDLQNEWHSLHGKRWPAGHCAGCEKPIIGLQTINMADGNSVHAEPIECLISFGRRWRDAADAALVNLGLVPPDAGNG